MTFERIDLRPGYSISRVLKGHWQLSDGHLTGGSVDRAQAIEDMRSFAEAGITTFDMADIYTGAEELVGEFMARYPGFPIQIHTKYVPDMAALATLRFEDTQNVIDRSLLRLGGERLDMVQFHWWDYAVPGYVEAALHLKRLQESGKIGHIGVTNFDVSHLKEIADVGVDVVSAQVQYSVLDRRPEKGFVEFCRDRGIHLLCYGALAGGLLSERYLGQPEPTESENRSLVKYRLIVDEIGGWERYQGILQALSAVAAPHGVTLSEVAAAYVLSRPQVAAVVIGAHNADHLGRLKKLENLRLSAEDIRKIEQVLGGVPNVRGDVYQIEREDPAHKGIMKVSLNSASFENPARTVAGGSSS